MINSDSRILSIHDLHLYRPNSNECYGSVHVVLNENLTLIEIEKILENIRFILSQVIKVVFTNLFKNYTKKRFFV
ncbi:cation diffusion facilitator family transporter [Aliarcobacter cryaerophilus]|nr:hypothetical protein RJG53_09840 [Arcobacter sp. AZ-2023]WNL21010.1 hypothetical protein RJG56_09720 [Arcobacter sp. AZ-2023]WPD10417.1 hypothetical protein QUR77_03390 [Arcobacter sp. DSM 115954]